MDHHQHYQYVSKIVSHYWLLKTVGLLYYFVLLCSRIFEMLLHEWRQIM